MKEAKYEELGELMKTSHNGDRLGSESVIEVINEKYYDKYGFERSANVYSASFGSKVIF